MRKQNILATLFFVIFASLASADLAGPAAGELPASSGQAGVVMQGDDMQPNPNPLAPDLPLTPPGTYPAVAPNTNNTMQQQSVPSTGNTMQQQSMPSTGNTMQQQSMPNTGNTMQQQSAPNTGNTMQQQPTQPQYTPEPYIPGPADNPADNPMMEQCKVVDSNGNGLIKAYMADSGPNLEGDSNAWIWVPRGQCTNINMGNFSGVSAQIRAKINPSDLSNAQTIE